MTPEICPNCGAEVSSRARVCPECGADETTGWSETDNVESLGIPEETFDHDEFVRREFGSKTPKPDGIHWVWWLIGVIVLIVMILMLI